MSPSVRLTLDTDELARGTPSVETVAHAADLLRTNGVVALSAGTLGRGVAGSAADMATLAAKTEPKGQSDGRPSWGCGE